MTLADPIQLIESLRAHPSETEWFEFKRGHFDPDDVGEYISALANSAMLHDQANAFLIYGIEDKTHEVVGTTVHFKDEKVKGEPFESYVSRFLSPKINISFEWCLIDNKHVEILCIEPAYDRPVRYKNVAYIRINSIKKRLDEFWEKERTLWQLTSRYSFEDGVAATHVSSQEILSEFACSDLCDLLYGKPLSDQRMIEKFEAENLIRDDKQGAFDITNLFALCAARDLTRFKTVAHKAPRVTVYKGTTKLDGTEDIDGRLGYAVAFKRILTFIMRSSGGHEVLVHGVRKFESFYPEVAVREFLANTLIHQNLMQDGGRPTIEIFSDKIQFTNPGEPLIELNRLIDAPPRSRNEKLAGLMRKARLCEDRGSGVDRALWAIEEAKLAPPRFATVEGSTIVTMYRRTNFAAMSKEDRIRACYQHSCLMHLKGDPMSNSTLRSRLDLHKGQHPQVSNVISDTISAGLIRPLDVDQGNRFAKYVPYWV